MMTAKNQKTQYIEDVSALVEDTIREFCASSADNSMMIRLRAVPDRRAMRVQKPGKDFNEKRR